MKVRLEIKSQVSNNRGNPGQIVTDKLAQYPVGVRVAAGKTATIKRSVRRIKRGNTPSEPASVREIPDCLKNIRSLEGLIIFHFYYMTIIKKAN